MTTATAQHHTYIIRTGTWLGPDSTVWTDAAYSGHGSGLNNPAMCAVHAVGPLPPGLYTIGDPLDPPDHLGPVAMPLTPDPGNEMHGRSAFLIHGDNARGDHSASDGCIVMGRPIRERIADDDCVVLRVVAEAV